MRVCVRACVRAQVRVCICARVRACVRLFIYLFCRSTNYMLNLRTLMFVVSPSGKNNNECIIEYMYASLIKGVALA